VYGGQVAVGISKGRIDLNGASVALKGRLQILHLLQRVAHVGVSIREGGGYAVNKGRVSPSVTGL